MTPRPRLSLAIAMAETSCAATRCAGTAAIEPGERFGLLERTPPGIPIVMCMPCVEQEMRVRERIARRQLGGMTR